MRKAVLGLLLSVTTMVVLGIVMLYSTGAFAQDAHGNPQFYIEHQAIWLAVGLAVCMVCARVDYHWWQKRWKPLFIGAVILLAAVFLTHKIHGSHRWLKVGPFSFQPSEMGKLAAVAFLATWFSDHVKEPKELFKGFLIPLCVVGFITALIAGEIDLGTASVVGGTMFAVMFIAGTRLWYLLPLGIGGVGGILAIGYFIPQRLGRMMAFLDLEKYKLTEGAQQWHGLIALGSGGVDGLGLGCGREKMLFLPFAHTDFIFPMVGEELGLPFTLLIVFCYVLMIVCGSVIAIHSRDRFGTLFGFGIVVLIALQAAMNIGVTTALLPNKGIPLPFISYGGSNLLFCLLGLGILLSIYRQGLNEHAARAETKLNARVTLRL